MNEHTCIPTITHMHTPHTLPLYHHWHSYFPHNVHIHTFWALLNTLHLIYRVDFASYLYIYHACMQAYYRNRVHSMKKQEAKCQLLKHMCQPSTTTAYFPVKVGHTYAHVHHTCTVGMQNIGITTATVHVWLLVTFQTARQMAGPWWCRATRTSGRIPHQQCQLSPRLQSVVQECVHHSSEWLWDVQQYFHFT